MKKLSDVFFAVTVIVIVIAAMAGVSLAQQVPFVQTTSATVTSPTTATLAGTVTPNGSETLVYFEYGTTTAFGTRTSSQSVGTGYSPVAVTHFATGLSANTVYYFRIVAQNQASFGIVPGAILTFTTGASGGAAPGITTNAATNVTATAAILRAYVSPNDKPASAWFEYGTSADALTMTTAQTPIADVNYYRTTSASPAVATPVSGLSPGVTYSFRAVVRSADGAINYGQILGFRALGNPPLTSGGIFGTSYYNPGAVNYTSYYQPYNPSPQYQPTPPSPVARAPQKSAAPAAQVAAARPSYYYRVPSASGNAGIAAAGNSANLPADRQTASVAEIVGGSGRTAGNIVFGLVFAFLILLIVTYTWRIFRLASYGV